LKLNSKTESSVTLVITLFGIIAGRQSLIILPISR